MILSNWKKTKLILKDFYYKKLQECCVGFSPKQLYGGWSVATTDGMMNGVPYIMYGDLYYEELNKGTVGFCNIDTKIFNPNHLSIVEGCLETDEAEWIYVNKIYYEGRPLKFEPLKHDLKTKYEKFKLIF